MMHEITDTLYTSLRRNTVPFSGISRACAYSGAQAVLSVPALINPGHPGNEAIITCTLMCLPGTLSAIKPDVENLNQLVLEH